jgi:hypothetical protein
MNYQFLIKVTYFYLIGFLLAVLEIQIEGEHGWAAKLPTWRAQPGSRLDKLFKKITAQKDLTGYHTALMIFLLLFMHWPFVWHWTWNIWQELEIMAIFILFTTVWDFLWFVLNPNLSLRKFNPDRVWWHKKWLGKMPIDYYFGILITILLFVPEMIWLDFSCGLTKLLTLLGVNLFLTTLTIIFYPKAY